MMKRRASSLVFLAFSMVIFFITAGIMFTLVPIILGTIWTATDENHMPIDDADWQNTYNQTTGQLQYIIPLVPTLLIAIAVIKVLMVASVKGRD